ncbi:ribosome biogenesis GTPase YqeH [Mycoplasmatota bacterium]|nr:ribosome biogenesis GTPase YqeH [Mycoplasmatota bacterium]
MMNEIKCMGCGSILQTDNEKDPGFIKKNLLNRETDELLCQRCFRLKHYREIADVDLSNDEFVKILSDIANRDALVVNVVDLFDISGSIISSIHRFIGSNEVLLVGNKRDILPKSIKDHKIKNWVRRIIKDYGYKVVDVALVSAQKGHGIDDLLEMIEQYRKGRDVYIIGCTNVGKSTLVNAIIKRFTEKVDDLITVSQFPGTTLGLIEIPLNKDNDIIDTPGIINSHQYAFYLNKKHLKHILPQKEIKPKVYQLESKQTLFFDGLARFDFFQGKKTSFVCCFNNGIKIHRTKLENADSLFERHIGELLSPPSVSEYQSMGAYVKHQFKTPREKCDVVISGLGFISIHEPNIQIIVWAPKNVGVYIRPSLF